MLCQVRTDHPAINSGAVTQKGHAPRAREREIGAGARPKHSRRHRSRVRLSYLPDSGLYSINLRTYMQEYWRVRQNKTFQYIFDDRQASLPVISFDRGGGNLRCSDMQLLIDV